jgi:hypothetical protein
MLILDLGTEIYFISVIQQSAGYGMGQRGTPPNRRSATVFSGAVATKSNETEVEGSTRSELSLGCLCGIQAFSDQRQFLVSDAIQY